MNLHEGTETEYKEYVYCQQRKLSQTQTDKHGENKRAILFLCHDRGV